jgi:hypothetical protein
MAATITGTLIGIEAPAGNLDASVDVALCGYGSRNPISQAAGNTGIFCSVEVGGLPGNAFNVDLVGNDKIVPAGTYYLFTFRDSNGDIVQCNAYVFLDGQTYDLATAAPFDPIQPIPPLPVPVTNMLLIVPPSEPEFDGSQYTAFKMTLDQDNTGAFLANIVPGNLYTFIIVQDAVGNHVFQWPTGPAPMGTRNATPVSKEPNATTVQTFVADEFGMLYAISAATYYL